MFFHIFPGYVWLLGDTRPVEETRHACRWLLGEADILWLPLFMMIWPSDLEKHVLSVRR